MRLLLCFIFSLGLPAAAMAQNCKRVYDPFYGKMVYTNPHKSPQFASRGDTDLMTYFEEHHKTTDTTGSVGTIVLEFVIDAKGRVCAPG